MTICHSLWSRPFKENRFGISYERQMKVSLYLAAISLIYLKNNGCYTRFYGDKEAIEIFSVLPYDEFVELNIPEDTNIQFWAQGKFYALEKMNLGDIHIDLDVFIKHPKIYKFLNTKADCIVQSLEDFENSISAAGYLLVEYELKDYKFSEECCTMEPNFAYNCGIIGFNNQEFKDRYLKHYMEVLKKIPVVNTERWWYSPDLVFEQKHLYELAKHYGYKVRALFGKQTLKIDEYNNSLPDKRFYEHVVSVQKFSKFDTIRYQLETLDRSLCHKLDELTKNISL